MHMLSCTDPGVVCGSKLPHPTNLYSVRTVTKRCGATASYLSYRPKKDNCYKYREITAEKKITVPYYISINTSKVVSAIT